MVCNAQRGEDAPGGAPRQLSDQKGLKEKRLWRSGAALGAEADHVELVLSYLVALLFGHSPRCFAQGALQLRGGVHVLDLPAGGADEVVVVARQLLGQLESSVVVGASDSADHAYLDERRHVPVRAALGELG